MAKELKYQIVAQKAKETFLHIRELRKTHPMRTKAERDNLKNKIKELQDKWWKEVNPYMQKDENYPPFREKE